MHCPSQNKLLLICPASTSLSPVVPVLTTRSLPAKSTTLNLVTFVLAACSLALTPFGIRRTFTVNTEWLLELSPFDMVAYVTRFCFPWLRTSRTSLLERMGTSWRPEMCLPPVAADD